MRINYICRNSDPSSQRESIYQIFLFLYFLVLLFLLCCCCFFFKFCLQLLVNINNNNIYNPPINFRPILEGNTGILVT